MKKVNFEAGERVDAPDANALSDVVHEELNRIISHMMLRSGYINPNVSGSFSHNYSELGNDWALESLRAVTFGHDFEITTQPDSGAGRYQITVSIADAAIIDGGNFIGDSPENPSVDLSGFADAAIGQYTYLMGRVKYKAGVAENRARWRSDLNPPREEIYRANTRRIPVFDARLYVEDELPPASDGWFKIAKITRTPVTDNNLRRFRFEDMRFVPTEGGHPSQRVSQPNQEVSHKGLLKESTVAVGRFGRGITQQINGQDVFIANAVHHYEVLPAKSNAKLNVINDNFFSTYNTSLHNEVTARSFRVSDLLITIQRLLRDNYEGDTQVIPSMDTVGDFILELTRVINEIKYGQDLFGGEDPDDLNVSGVKSKRTLSWRNSIGRTSLAANNTDFVIGFAVDSACNELMPMEAFSENNGLNQSLFLARYLLNIKDLSESSVNPSHHVVFTGFMGESEYTLTDAVFGGTAILKGSPTFRKHGGLLVRGASPAATGRNANTLTGLSDITSSLIGAGVVSAVKGRTVFGNGAVVRKHSAGAPLVWADAFDDRQPDTELTIDGLNFTDLCPIFSWDKFIQDTTVTDGVSASPAYSAQATQYLNDGELADGPLLYANRGGLTVQNCWFMAFHNGTTSLQGNITHRVSSEANDLVSRPVEMQSSAISIEMVHQDFAKPIVFKSVNFLRYKGTISGDTNREMIRINAGEAVSGQSFGDHMTVPQVIFDGCFFADWVAVGDALGGLRITPFPPSLSPFFQIDESISHLVTFKNCIFKIASLQLLDARLENCTFLDSGSIFTDPVLAAHPQRRTTANDLAAGDRASFFLKQKPASSLTTGDRIHANTVSASDLQLMPHGQINMTLGQQVVELSNNLQRHIISSDRYVQRTSDLSTDADIRSIIPVFSAYFADTAGKIVSPLNVVQFRAVDGNEEAQTLDQTQQTNRVVLETAGYTKLSNTLPVPALADRATVNSTMLNHETVFLSHSSYQGEMIDNTRPNSDIQAGAILKEPIRAPFTFHGNLMGYHPTIAYFGEQVATLAAARTRGFTVETPINLQNNPLLAYTSRLQHPYMKDVRYQMGQDANGDLADTSSGFSDLTQRDTHKFYMNASTGNITTQGGNLKARYNEESHIGASVCRLSTQSEEAFQPELAALAGVTRHTTTSLRLHGVVALGQRSGNSENSIKDRLFVRAETGAGESMYRDIEFSTIFGDDAGEDERVMGDVVTTPRGTFTPAALYSRSTRDASNDIGLIELDLLSAYNPQGGNGSDFVSKFGIVNNTTKCHLASMLFSLYAPLGRNSLSFALEANAPRESEGHLRSALSVVSTNAVTHVPPLNDGVSTCREVRLSLVPVRGALDCARFYIMAEKIHQDFSISRGLLRTRAANGEIQRHMPRWSVYSDNTDAFVASSADLIAGNHAMNIEFVVDLYLHA